MSMSYYKANECVNVRVNDNRRLPRDVLLVVLPQNFIVAIHSTSNMIAALSCLCCVHRILSCLCCVHKIMMFLTSLGTNFTFIVSAFGFPDIVFFVHAIRNMSKRRLSGHPGSVLIQKRPCQYAVLHVGKMYCTGQHMRI